MTLFLWVWSAIWTAGMPFVLLYLARRARKDAVYGQHLGERFGRYHQRMSGSVWVHAVSLGELRSAVPMVRGLLDAGERVVITNTTPAGRRASLSAFGEDIAAGQVVVVWVPFELDWCFAGFFAAFRPKIGLVMEIEIWPRLVQAAKDRGVPLYMCNAQYPSKSMARDAKFPLRPAVMRRFAGGFVKSDLQAARFASVGLANTFVTGELRFDQPIPDHHLRAAAALRPQLGGQVIAFASVTEPEEQLFIQAALALRAQNPQIVIVFIPRAPERFDAVAAALAQSGLSVMRRSTALAADLSPLGKTLADVILGDSLGEMYFYLALAQRAVIGGGFQPKGSHNIIEPLALGLPVLVGPSIHTIEYPALEAIAAGVCKQTDAAHLVSDILTWRGPDAGQIAAFQKAYSGASQKTLAALAPLLLPR